jgi:hypothetical protein
MADPTLPSRLPNVPLLSCGRIQESKTLPVTTTEPVVVHHGRQDRPFK